MKFVNTHTGNVWKGEDETAGLFNIIEKMQNLLDGSDLFNEIVEEYHAIDEAVSDLKATIEMLKDENSELEQRVDTLMEERS
jgi:chromosome segregation ATPase